MNRESSVKRGKNGSFRESFAIRFSLPRGKERLFRDRMFFHAAVYIYHI